MRTMKFLLLKEFRQIFRDISILRMIFVLPLVQLLVMPLAADFEIKNINVSIVDNDHSTFSKRLSDKIIASGYFKLNDYGNSFNDSFNQFQKDNSDLVLEIPKNFEKELTVENRSNLFLAVNAINGTKAAVGSGYLSRIIENFNTEIRTEINTSANNTPTQIIQIETSNWFNRFLKYTFFIVPGILVSLVTMVGVNMCAMNIVREKEIGTIEQINVTPVKKYHFILAKLIPFWFIGNIIFSLGLLVIARLVYGIVPLGSYWVLYSFLSLFLIAVLGIGLLISTYCTTQQQSMSLAFFFTLIFFLMSGLFTSVDSMPEWAKFISKLSPVTHFIEATRMVVQKGSGFEDIKGQFIAVGLMAIFFNTWAIFNYRKTN
ncbi:ABC transporter permease [Flavobacterium sp. NRK F10]|uniref:ABC transporter permease n=1 Tax=Flavobacterium sp. NRK F10 TaxID=2954931 RepID=UPI002091B7EE|nr:ABC transporter permease [Flavobacterium sp. NRK F10]MCO6175912.1 ABC transporter permease [Flavobacterium sp. NRK F10]